MNEVIKHTRAKLGDFWRKRMGKQSNTCALC